MKDGDFWRLLLALAFFIWLAFALADGCEANRDLEKRCEGVGVVYCGYKSQCVCVPGGFK